MADGGAEVEVLVRGGHPDFLDLPWTVALTQWDHERLVPMAHGVSRHVVRFVRYDNRVYAIKETDAALAAREHRTLRTLLDVGLPVVESVGFVRDRGLGEVGALITRYLDYSLPYWYVLGREAVAAKEVLIDAAVVLLVRLHLAGVFWGDCSLSNVLFRRDGGAMMTYLVDAETAEKRPSINDRLRAHDLEIAHENVVGGLLDLQAAERVPTDADPVAIADELRDRYEELWEELTRTDRFDSGEPPWAPPGGWTRSTSRSSAPSPMTWPVGSSPPSSSTRCSTTVTPWPNGRAGRSPTPRRSPTT